jgi:UDP-glucose 4-epimerase
MGSLVVAVTGVSRQLGAEVAIRLAASPEVARVVGIDMASPRCHLAGVDFFRTDLRGPAIGRVLTSERVDTVVHLSVTAAPAAQP